MVEWHAKVSHLIGIASAADRAAPLRTLGYHVMKMEYAENGGGGADESRCDSGADRSRCADDRRKAEPADGSCRAA